MFEAVKQSIARFIYRSVSYSVRNSYEAGSTGRRLSRWNPPSSGPNASIIGDLERLRARSRELVRNNPWITRGINSWVANEIGCDITFKSAAPHEEFRKRADDLWERQCRYFDADGMQHFSGMLSQIVRTRRDAGEIFIRRRSRRPSDSFPVPVQYQLLEPELCPVQYSDIGPARRIYAGIEFNLIGKRTAYNPDVDDKYDPLTGEPIDKDYAGVPVSNIEAGSFFATLPGEDVKLFEGDSGEQVKMKLQNVLA